MRTSRAGAKGPAWGQVGNRPMANVAPPIMLTVMRKALLRPSRSPRRPKIKAPTGRKKKPAPKSASAASRPAVGSSSAKKFLAMTGVKAPKTKKSYHSKVVPATDAAITVRMEIGGAADAAMPDIC